MKIAWSALECQEVDAAPRRLFLEKLQMLNEWLFLFDVETDDETNFSQCRTSTRR